MKSLGAERTEHNAALQALLALAGPDVVNSITASARTAPPVVRRSLVEVIEKRRATSALPDLLELSNDPDAGVARAAIRAIGKLAGPADIPAVVAALLRTPPGQLRQEFDRAVTVICASEEGRSRFIDAFKDAAPADADRLLSTLAGIGGAPALAVVDELIASADAGRRSLGFAASSRWPDATVVPRVFDLLATARDGAEREMLVNALIRIASLPTNRLKDEERLDLMKRTMAICSNDAERSRLLERANAVRTVDTLRFVLLSIDRPGLAEAASRSVVELAHHKNLRDAHKDEFLMALDKVITLNAHPELVERAKLYKEGRTWDRKR